jgi:RHS repeat-associated protein
MRPLVPAPAGPSDWQTRFFHSDYIGSIRALTDDAGAVTDRYQYDAWGNLLSHVGSDPQPYAFAGEPYDPNVGFQYHRARWMDPRVGRFLGMDGFRGNAQDPTSLHKYLYVSNSPLNAVDPTGFAELSLGGQLAVAAIIGILAGAAIGGLYGGKRGAAIGAIAGAIAAPTLLLTGYAWGVAIAEYWGVSEATGVLIANSLFGVVGGVFAAEDLYRAETPRQQLAASIALLLSVTPFLLRPHTGGQPVILRLRYRPNWSPEQIQAANAKVAALNDAAHAGELVRTPPVRSGTSASARYRQACGSIPGGCDVDHIRDLQLGGEDLLSNMAALDASVNRSLGAQIYQQTKTLPEGSYISGVVIE